ncbi:hypothetical protein LCR02_17680 [Flavonifractor plautii]|jgi:hypothetical protein|uniref:hypothetical protein n=1 Tax=Flavonifractor plautii TaxID=292800 RepID=UPI001CD21734|nr:hypothetical protein [Flavonifractor plautii]UBS60696.1 hypothetical protein LCR02_17680 [Flavonifractor plautii]UWF89572.1 MAG: hypothetical protein [Bacteriophage sp.]UYJ49533.1 MAG: hypothetical protein OGM82_16700 [Flavonifractor plautii]
MAFTKSDKLKQVIFQEEIDGVLTDLMARTHVDNVIYEEGGKQIALSEKLASLIATVATKADSNNVTADIKTATDNLYNKIMGITAEDGAPVAEAYDTLKEVANYLTEHGSVVQGFTNDISGLKKSVEDLKTGMTKVEKSDTNGNVKVDGAEVVVYQHPSSHPASMITDTAEKVMMTAAERTKLSGVTAGASAIVSGTGAVADASAVPTLMIKVIEDTDNT